MSAPAPSMFSPAAREIAQRLGLKMGRANLEEFADTLLATGRKRPANPGRHQRFARLRQTWPVRPGVSQANRRSGNCGAEPGRHHRRIGRGGKKSFAVSPACFLTARSLEQIKNDICYSDVPAKIIGISAGVSYGALGSTHHSLHDFAALRAIHNITIVVPADNFETREAIRAAAKATHPVYLRFGKAAMYDVHAPGTKFQIGKSITVRDGNDVAFIATGETVVHALLAAEKLAEMGLKCRVVACTRSSRSMTKPFCKRGRQCRAIITVEEHSVHGGLGEACAAVLMQAGVAVPFRIVGIPDEDTVTGSQADIFRHYGITMEGLAPAC